MPLQVGNNHLVGRDPDQLNGESPVGDVQNGGRAATLAIRVATVRDPAVQQGVFEHLMTFFTRTHTVDE